MAMNKFEKIIKQYDYADRMKPGGFCIDGKPALTKIDPALIGDYVIMVVRDPLLDYSADPAEILGKRLENAVLAGRSGMFTTISGYYKGAHISIVSGGSGSPEAELILVEFMHHTKAHSYVRLGGGAGINEKVKSGDVVIASGIVRDDGMTQAYVCPAYPAVSSYELVVAFARAAEALGHPFHIGVGRSGDSEHVGCGRPSVGGYFQPAHSEIIDYYNRAGVLYWDRESSAVVTLSSLFGRRGGAVCSVDNNLVTNEPFKAGNGHDNAIEIVFEGLAFLHAMDEKKLKCNQTYWIPHNGEV